jgi:hypothetical protein
MCVSCWEISTEIIYPFSNWNIWDLLPLNYFRFFCISYMLSPSQIVWLVNIFYNSIGCLLTLLFPGLCKNFSLRYNLFCLFYFPCLHFWGLIHKILARPMLCSISHMFPFSRETAEWREKRVWEEIYQLDRSNKHWYSIVVRSDYIVYFKRSKSWFWKFPLQTNDKCLRLGIC